jgi:hypothetical protein
MHEPMKSMLKEAVREEPERFFEQVSELTERRPGKLEASVVNTS